MNTKTKGILLTIASALLFGVTPVLASLTYDMGSNASTLTFYRNLMVVPVLIVVMLVKKIPFRLHKKELGLILLVGIVFRASTTSMTPTNTSASAPPLRCIFSTRCLPR